MTQEIYNESFVQDCTEFIENIKLSINSLNSNKKDKYSINEIFRYIHSIKSEAAYYDHDSLGVLTGKLEDVLEKIRKEEIEADDTILRNIRNSIDLIYNYFSDLKNNIKDDSYLKQEINNYIDDYSNDEENKIKVASKANNNFFNELENKLLDEAFKRKESIYKLTCYLDESIEMKYPRVFLLVNNLELKVNVIKIFPEFDTISKNDSSVFDVYFSTNEDINEVYEAANIDQINRLGLIRMDQNLMNKKTVEYGKINSFENVLFKTTPDFSIKEERLDLLSNYNDEIKSIILKMNKQTDHANTGPYFNKLLLNSDKISKIIKETRLISIDWHFKRLPLFIHDLSEELDKKINIEIKGSENKFDKRLLNAVSNSIIHLIKNAADHGIESPDERLNNGKSEIGKINLEFRKNENIAEIIIEDDGRGINIGEIKKKAEQAGIDSNKNILEILSMPGFTTKENTSGISGRGAGLDQVYKDITQKLNGKISIDTEYKKGTRFVIKIPGMYSFLKIYILRIDEKNIAVAKRNIEKIIEIDKTLFKKDKLGLVYYNDYEVFTENGRLIQQISVPDKKMGIVMSCSGKKAVLLIDDVVFEREIQEEKLEYIDEISPYLYKIAINNEIKDFLYLLPSIIS